MRTSVLSVLGAAFMTISSCMAAEAQEMRFDFGDGQTMAGYTQVRSSDAYSESLGYGFESDVAMLSSVTRTKGDALTSDFVTSDQRIRFKVRLPEGNYRVTLTLGDTEGESVNTVKAEERRLMAEHLTTGKGETVRFSFNVNIRTPKLTEGNRMKLDVREWDPQTDRPVSATWDDGLSVSLTDARPALCAMTVEPLENATVIFLMGDSTVTDQVGKDYGTWGQYMTRWLTGDVVVANHAESGQTVKGFRFQRRWDKILDQIKEGDYVFMQFGHNDLNDHGHDAMWENEDSAGEWIYTYADAMTDYKWALATYALEVKRHGGIPVIVTPMTKYNIRTGELNIEGMREYPEGARQAALLADCALIDLNAMSIRVMRSLGPENATKAYVDGLHSNNYGGYLFAKCIIKGIQDGIPELAGFISPDWTGFDLDRPEPLAADFDLPEDPNVPVPVPPGMRGMLQMRQQRPEAK